MSIIELIGDTSVVLDELGYCPLFIDAAGGKIYFRYIGWYVCVDYMDQVVWIVVGGDAVYGPLAWEPEILIDRIFTLINEE